MAELPIENILPDIENLIEQQETGTLLNIIVDLHPADIETILNQLKPEQRKYLFNLLPAEIASSVIPELDDPVIEDILENISNDRLTSIIHEMDSDDAADLVAELDKDVKERVLKSLKKDVSKDVNKLLGYKDDTAGGIMALEVISVDASATVNETIEKIRQKKDEVVNIYKIWVTNEKGIYLGSVSLSNLVLAKGEAKINTIMDESDLAININLDQEEVAKFFSRYDLVSAPVVDDKGRLVGRITIDDIVDVMEEERSEDIARISGAPDEEIREDSAFIISKARIPWLLVAFVGELIAAYILSFFELEASQQLIVAAFIPIVMAMGGASGTQASVTVVRGLAMGDIELKDTGRRLFKEFRVSIFSSTFFSILLFTIVYFWHGVVFAIILGGSMFIVINNATVTGAFVPLIFKRLNIDPALAAAPLVSTSNDIFGILIYLSITTVVLSIAY
jgi:magnesium transporter